MNQAGTKRKSNNPKGRPMGSPNRTTREMREQLQKILNEEMEQWPEIFQALPADKRLELVLKILPYVCPKFSDKEAPGEGVMAEMLDEGFF